MAEVSIAGVNAAIEALIATPEVDYKIGDKQVKAGQKLTQLLSTRRDLMENPAGDLALISFDASDVDEFGVDDSQEVL